MTKEQARITARKKRSDLPEEIEQAADAHIAFNLVSTALWKHAPAVYTYVSVDNEVDTRSLIQTAWNQDKDVFVPRCCGKRELQWYTLSSFENLEPSSFGLLEPKLSAPKAPDEVKKHAIALVPGLLFDKCGNRLGQGRGYFDVFLSTFKGISIGLCRGSDLKDELFALGLIEDHDIACDVVITEESMYLTH